MAFAAELRVGRYRLFHRIGAGGMASVYLGRLSGEKGFARVVAVKRLHPHCAGDPKLVESLFREARIVSRIRHPNVVAVLDVVTEGEENCLVLEYVHGETLHRLVQQSITRAKPIPPPIAARIAIDVLEGLHAAHEAKDEAGAPLHVVHRDVSPHNVLVDASSGGARLVDFGIAKVLARPQTTQTGQLKGKLSYMAPEQVDGRDVDRFADLWAVGVLLWELLTLARLFEGSGAPEIIFKVLSGAIPRPRSALGPEPALEDVVMKCLERVPAQRFTTAREAARAIEAAISPASSREVVLWHDDLAGDSLKERQRWLEEVERAPEGRERAPTTGPSWRTAVLGAAATALVSAGLVAFASGRPAPPVESANTGVILQEPDAAGADRPEISASTALAPPLEIEPDAGPSALPAGSRARPRGVPRPPRSPVVPSAVPAPSGSGDALRLHERR